MDDRKYSAEDLALDEKFQKWVLDPDAEVDGFWNNWRRANPDQNAILEEAAALVRAAGLSSDAGMNQAYLEVWQELEKNAATAPAERNWRLTRIAATVAFLVVGSFILWKVFQNGEVANYQTAFGEIREFSLEDGSTVTLNSNSRLYVTTAWNDRSVREVRLEGEAFFDVVKTGDGKGFEVSTNEDVKISVLGTKFNVNARREEVKVYLKSGKVMVNSTVGEALLYPGDFAIYRNGESSLTVNRSIGDASSLLDWKDELFVFNDAPLSDIVRELEDNYGFSVRVEGKDLLAKRITAKVPRTDVNILLDVLSETLEVRIEREGNALIFR